MAVTVLKPIVLLAALCSIANALTDEKIFMDFIKDRCYNKTHNNEKYLVNGQTIPLSNSIETLIDLLERFERNYSSYSPSEVAEAFITRFQINNLVRTYDESLRKYKFERSSSSEDNRDEEIVEAIIFGPRTRKRAFPEEAFTEDEKCALYYMLSHSIVDCKMDEDIQKIQQPDRRDEKNKCYIEQGVVTLHNHKVHAIAPGKVLLGILAGLKHVNEMLIKDLVDSSSINSQILNEKINPIYGVTVGSVVVREMLRAQDKKNTRKFGPNGEWNSTTCPTRYTLDPDYEPTKATYAELRGAGDGVLLGLVAQKLKEKNENVAVSSLLRMYYSLHGLLIPGEANRFSYCNRYNNWLARDEKLKQEIKIYAKLMSAKTPLATLEDNELNVVVNNAFNAFETSRKEIADIVTDDKRCLERTELCEKQANVFIIMDNRGNEISVENRQEEMISEIASYLYTSLYGGTITILSRTRGFVDRQLESIVFNTTSKGCVGCSMDWYLPQQKAEDESYVFESINKTLMYYEYETAMLPGVPGKVLIYFNYAEKPPIKDRKFDNALWDVQNKHRDVPIIAIGKSPGLLKMITKDDIFDDDLHLVDTINDKICRSFSTFQYPQCEETKSSLDDYSAYEGYITPAYTQYWAMYPEYFLKSFKIQFHFYAEDGDIEVCFSRSNKGKFSTKYCATTSKQDKDRKIVFKENNPCKGKNVYNCDPLYFKIVGKDHDGVKICKEKECKYLDQIKFTVKHEGISCNGSSSLVASLQAIIAIFVLLCVVRKNV